MKADPEKARALAGQVVDAELAGTISEIVEGYE